jgi:hypothetical protein
LQTGIQVQLKALAVSPRRTMQQIVEYKNDSGNGYGKTLLCFIQLFIVSNRTDTWYFANNNLRHFSFNADERFLPIYQFAAEDNKKITHLDTFAEKFLAKCVLGEMISRYMVRVASEQKLLMMRPRRGMINTPSRRSLPGGLRVRFLRSNVCDPSSRVTVRSAAWAVLVNLTPNGPTSRWDVNQDLRDRTPARKE